DEDYLNQYIKSSGCKTREGQRSIYNFFKPTKNNLVSEEDEEDEWNSDIYDNMNNDDLLQVDEIDELEEMNDNTLALIVPTNNKTSSNKSISKKRSLCQDLQSEQIFNYIKRSPAQFSGLCHVEIVARKLFPKLFRQKFNRKKLTYNQKRMLNHALYAESTWQIDQNNNAMHAKTCSGVAEKGNICNECHYIQSNKNLCNRLSQKMLSLKNIKFMPKFYWKNSSLKNHFQNRNLHDVWNLLNNYNENQSNPWIMLADKAINRAFKDLPVFSGLCQVMSDAAK
ncbi:26194_t:CDS:2, partial [Gigaspora margarita]